MGGRKGPEQKRKENKKGSPDEKRRNGMEREEIEIKECVLEGNMKKTVVAGGGLKLCM